MIEKLKSRKFLFALSGAVIAVLQYLRGEIDANLMMAALTTLSVGYGVREGIADAGGRR